MYSNTDMGAEIERAISLISTGKQDEAVKLLRSLSGEIASAIEEMEMEKEELQNELDECREDLEDCQEEKESLELEDHREPVFF